MCVRHHRAFDFFSDPVFRLIQPSLPLGQCDVQPIRAYQDKHNKRLLDLIFQCVGEILTYWTIVHIHKDIFGSETIFQPLIDQT